MLKLAAVIPGYHPADQQPPEVRRQRHENEIQAQAGAGDQDHGAPAEMIRERALHRREDELHQRPSGAEHTVHLRGARGVAAHEVLHQHGQHGNDHAEGQHVDEHRDEDEWQRGLAMRLSGGFHGRKFTVVSQGFTTDLPPVGAARIDSSRSSRSRRYGGR